VWNLAPWPLESTPRHPELCEARAYAIVREGPGYRVADVRELNGTAPDEVYPQHVCPVWRIEQGRANEDARRAQGVLDRMTRE